MLITAVDGYLSLRQTLGFKLRDTTRILHTFARFATAVGDTHVRAETAIRWAETAPSPRARHVRLREIVRLARFLAAEDPAHEVPKMMALRASYVRPLPYIYSPDEISRIVAAAGRIRAAYPLRRAGFATLLGLIAATGLRVSEALKLRFNDIGPDGVLQIRLTKFGKSRIVPLHPTTSAALGRYLAVRRSLVVPDDHLFLSAGDKRISSSTMSHTFRRILKLAGIGAGRTRTPRVHDLRHTFATRALERSSSERKAVARHFVALSTYLGHVDIKQTYWYLTATPDRLGSCAAPPTARSRPPADGQDDGRPDRDPAKAPVS